MSVSGPAQQELLEAFRVHYRRYEAAVRETVTNSADAVVLWRLGDDLEQYIALVNEVGHLFLFFLLTLTCFLVFIYFRGCRIGKCTTKPRGNAE
jgi:hypothetical protein